MPSSHAVHFAGMANLAQFDLGTRGREARVRALLEDLVQEHMGVRPQFRLAMAVWFRKSPSADEQNLLELLTGPPIEGIARDRLSLLWKTGSASPPYVNIYATSVDDFLKLAVADPNQTALYQDN